VSEVIVLISLWYCRYDNVTNGESIALEDVESTIINIMTT